MNFPFTEIIGYLKSIKEVGDKSKQTIERLEQNWDKDREDFTEFKNRLSHLETEFASFKETVSKIPNQTRDRVAEANQPVIDEAQDLKNVIVEKEMVAIDKKETKKQRKPWWKVWQK